jgi:hypothetical protein
MLTFNATIVLPLLLQTCLHQMEESAHSPIKIFAPSSQIFATLKFSKITQLLINPWTHQAVLASLVDESQENSTLLAVIRSAAQLRFILDLQPQRFARRLFILLLAPVPTKAEILRGSGFAGCVSFLEMSPLAACPPCDGTDARTEIRMPGFSWPPMMDTLGLIYQPGDLVPAEQLSGVTVEIQKIIGKKLNLKFVYSMIPEFEECADKTKAMDTQLTEEIDAVYLPLWAKFSLG